MTEKLTKEQFIEFFNFALSKRDHIQNLALLANENFPNFIERIKFMNGEDAAIIGFLLNFVGLMIERPEKFLKVFEKLESD